MIDIQLLRLCIVRSDYYRVVGCVRLDALDTKTRVMIKDIGRYYEKHESHGTIDFSTFIPFVERLHPDREDEEVTAFRNIMKNMTKAYPDEDTRNAIFYQIGELNLVRQLANVVDGFTAGKEIDPVDATREALKHYDKSVESFSVDLKTDRLDDYFDDLDNDEGLTWRLECLNKAMKPLRPGMFGLIAARPDQGKTSFIADQLSYMAKQTDQPFLWLNNEGSREEIASRIYQAALNMTSEEVRDLDHDKRYELYCEALNGENKIQVVDVQGWNNSQVQDIIEQINPRLVVFDMLDHVHGFNDAPRRDLQLEYLYQWVREHSVTHNYTALATSQISEEGKNERFPGLGMLKDSKTGKQGATNFQLMMGSMEDDIQYINTRWLVLPKNKIRVSRSQPLKAQVTFDRDKSRFRELEIDAL